MVLAVNAVTPSCFCERLRMGGAASASLRLPSSHPHEQRSLGLSVRKPMLSRRRVHTANGGQATAPPMVLLDFTRDNCGPCKLMEEFLEKEVRPSYPPDELLITQLPVDLYPDMASSYGVQSLPTAIILKDNDERWRTSGFRSTTRQHVHRAIRLVSTDMDLVVGGLA